MTTLMEPTAEVQQPRAEVPRGLGSIRPAHVIAVALVLGAAITRLGPPGDPDTWWNLRTGSWILDHRAIPHSDPWSAVASGRDWVDHEWLSQVIWILSYRIGGYHGVSVLNSLLVLILLAMLAVQIFRRTTPYRALGLTALTVLGTCSGWAARPQLSSFLLLVPAAAMLRSGVVRGRTPWTLIPIVWLWANLHGLWVLAPLLTAAVAIGLLLDSRGTSNRLYRNYFALALGMIAAAAVTPNGPAILRAPMEVAGVGKYVDEWGPVPLTAVYGIGFFGLVGIYLLILARSGTRTPWTELVPVVFAVVLGLRYVRTVAPAVIILAPYVAARLSALRVAPPRRPDRVSLAALAATIGIGVAGGVVAVRETPSLPEHAPVAASAVINALPGEQRVINEYGLGGWVLWATPHAHPLIDGRAELYGNEYIGQYLNALAMAGEDWQTVLLRDHPTVAFLHRTVPAAIGLQQVVGWHSIYSDDTWIVLVPPAATDVAAP
jgi:hypothetical protein